MRVRSKAVMWQAVAAFLLLGQTTPAAQAAAQTATEWGWPQPYDKISDKSIDWLKGKGWWPLGIGWQAPFSGENAINLVMEKERLLEKRGLNVKFSVFAAGPDVNEAIASTRVQVGNGGNFPYTSLLDRGVPVRALATVAPNLKHSTVVPPDSPIKKLADFKGSNPPATIGIVTGSSSEFYFTQAAEVVGLQIGKDVILKNMPPAEQMLMPRGIGGIVPWEPSVTITADIRKVGREVDTIFPYNMFAGLFYVRQELIDNVPDVVQAISDSFMEASLWIRLHPDKTADYLAAEPMLKVFGKDLLLQQVELYNNLYKPTYSYPFAKLWGEEDARIAKWLKDRNRITKALSAKDYEQSFAPEFMQKTYAKLGWKVPSQPPFIPANWPGKIGQLPYPPFDNVTTLKSPQPWPEPGDLTQPWTFNGKTYQP